MHSIIEVKEMADYYFPAKPDIAADGAQFKCSNCGHVTSYYRADFIYQAYFRAALAADSRPPRKGPVQRSWLAQFSLAGASIHKRRPSVGRPVA